MLPKDCGDGCTIDGALSDFWMATYAISGKNALLFNFEN